ncbi:uncharacterized protein LOC103699485 [Phoenix dactylifera]|uniref:Uncharacterized protein LOC103699485 n=1 Tax=Phoenix dactylifera TaxID=42345 RepID=A0A8B9ALQ6_PHODC|nr:uncharacterized protein LOC103699485 [Phoenix dactylifera]
MSRYPNSGLEQLRQSLAYKCMKMAKFDEFEPTTIHFATYQKAGESTNWKKCLPLKAAIVYHCITGEHVKEETKDGEPVKGKAQELLENITKECVSRINKAASEAKTKGSTDRTSITVEDDAQVMDGIFLVVGFLAELKKHLDNGNREEAVSYYNLTPSESQIIVKDIIKIENQLPLELIKDIVNNVEDAIKAVETPQQQTFGYKLSFKKIALHDIINQFCWYYSPFHRKEPRNIGDVLEKGKPEYLLQCLHFSLKGDKTNGATTGQVRRSPSARQLKRSGVRLEATSEATIDVLFSRPKLQMPALVYDFKLETVVTNLLGWECWPEKQQKPMTRYLQFTTELVGDLSDVQVMKKFGLIRGRWKNLQEVLDLMKRIDRSASYPSVYIALDKQIGEVLQYHDERMKSFFVRNRPTVVWLSSFAAASAIATVIYASRRRRQG